MLEGLSGKNSDKEGTTREGRQHSGVFIFTPFLLDPEVETTLLWQCSRVMTFEYLFFSPAYSLGEAMDGEKRGRGTLAPPVR